VRGGDEDSGKINFRKNLAICLGKLHKQNHRPVKLSYSFSPQLHKNSGELKLFTPKVKDSPMHLVSIEYHGLLRRVAARSNQGRNDGGQEGKIPHVRITMRASNDCGGRRKVLTRSQVLQCSRPTFASERPQVRTWGRQTCFLPLRNGYNSLS